MAANKLPMSAQGCETNTMEDMEVGPAYRPTTYCSSGMFWPV
jgi:hypothetical protein